VYTAESKDANDVAGNVVSSEPTVFISVVNAFGKKPRRWDFENIPKEALKPYVK
jgi:hypothetical protein